MFCIADIFLAHDIAQDFHHHGVDVTMVLGLCILYCIIKQLAGATIVNVCSVTQKGYPSPLSG